MKINRLIRFLTLPFGISLVFGALFSIRLADGKDKAIAAYAYEGTPLPTSGTLSSGTYYLSSDLTVSSQLRITSGDVIVNLNGWTLNGGGRDKGIFYVTGGTLTVNGKDDETGKRGALNNGGGYYPGSGYSYGGALYITAGGATLSDLDITNCQSNWGGAIHMSNSAVTLNNCNLSNNIDTNGYGFYGAISVGNSSTAGQGLTVNGGEMFSNNAAIYLGDKAKATINGVNIHDNDYYGARVATNEGEGGLTITGNTIIKDNDPSSSRNLVINNNAAKVGIVSELGNDAYIGVTISGGDAKGVFTSGWSTIMGDAEPSDYFFSDSSSYAIDLQNGEACVTEAVASVSVGASAKGYAKITSAISAWNSAASGATLTLLKDVTISSTINVSTTKTLDLNGYGINASGISSNTDYAILVNNGGNLTLNDSGNTTHYFTHERYKGYDAGLATVCDKATYDAASEDSRGTFEGGYLTGLSIVKGEVSQSGFFKIEENSSVTMNGGTIIGIYADYSSSCVCSNGTFIMNDGNMIYNVNARGCINARSGILTINGGNISHNTDKSSKNTGRTGALWLNNLNNPTYTIRGGTITNNVAINGAINTQSDIAIEGNPVIKDNIGVGTDENSDAPMNIVLSYGIESKLNFVGEYTSSEPLGVSIYMDNVSDVTNSADVSFNNRNNVVSDNPDYAIGMYPSNHAKAGQLFYKGVETINVIDAIDSIGPLTYDGGKDDSLQDIITAIDGYNNLPQADKDFIDGINKDVLDHDVLVYNHVDKAGDLIKAIPEASDSQEYYDAVDAALAAYNALTEEEKAILNAALDFQYKKTLDDNVAAKEVIEIIQGIGEVTYKGGQDDSKDDIETAIDAYDNLTEEQKAIVDNTNKDDLDDAKETYDNVDEAVNLINSIGDINHGGDNDSEEAIAAAREAYDALSAEEKALVSSYNDSTQALEDAEEVYDVLVKIDDAGDDEEKIKTAREAYDALTPEQKDKVSEEHAQKLTAAIKHSRDANIIFIVFLILFILLIVSGLFVMYVLLKRRKDDSNNNNKQVKLASVTGSLPFVILASYLSFDKFIILYVLAAVAILVWLTNLILFVFNKRQKEAKVEAKSDATVSTVPQVTQTELINEDEEEVETIKDEKGNIFQIRFIKSFTAKLIQSPEETKKYYEELKNEVLSYKKTNSRISWHYDAINSGRNYVLKFAVRGKTLCVYLPLNVDDYVDSKYKVEKVESKKFEDVPCLYRIKNDRRLGYAKELIAVVAERLGLEKGEEQHEVYSNLPYEPNKPLVARGLIKEQKIQVNKPTEPVVLETKTNSDGDEVVVTKDASGNIFEIRYIKSFTAKLSQSEGIVKDYYTILKNYVLSYKGVHSRVSWHYDAINIGRDYVLKFAIRGKTLCVYYALDVSKVDDKYKVEDAKGKKFEDVPCLYRIKNDRRCEYAKELIDMLMRMLKVEQKEVPNEDYRIKKESTKALLAKGLIKEVKSRIQDKKVIEHYESITVSKADEVMSDQKAEALVEEETETKVSSGKKEIINIDTLSMNYSNGDVVTIDSLIEKKLISSKAGQVKVLARGELNKKLTVVANDFSIQAIKMIALTGGRVKKIK